MRILLPCDNYLYRYNGEIYAKSQEEYDLFKRYIRVFDFLRLVGRCSDVNELKPTYVPITDSRIEIVTLPMFRGPFQFLKVFKDIKNRIKNIYDGVDAGVLRLPSIMGSYMGYEMIRRHLPYITENLYDSQDGYRSSERLSEIILWRLMDCLQRHLCYKADGVSCVTQYYMQRRYYTKKKDGFYSHYSTLALYPSFYTAPRKFPSQKKTFGIIHIANPVVTKGRKGHEQMIMMLERVVKKDINANVFFIGGGTEEEINKLKVFANECGVGDRVTFTGFLSKDEIRKFLLESDLYVMPTKAEGLPRVVIEAMSVGLPCISSKISGLPELLDSHYLTEYHDVDKMANLVIELLTRPELYESVSRENYEKSKAYEASILEARRDLFYAKLKSKVSAGRQ